MHDQEFRHRPLWVAREKLTVDVGLRLAALLVRAMAIAVLAGALIFFAMWSAKKWLGWYPSGPVATLFLEAKQEAQALLYVYDNHTGWKGNPFTQLHSVSRGPLKVGEPRDVRLRTNSEGFFDREHNLHSSFFRVAFVGDSWVEAQQVDASNRFTELVEGYVFAQSRGEKAVESMNFGISNLGTAQEYGVIKEYVLKYRPDEIWIVFNPRDDISDSSPLFTSPPLGPTFRYQHGVDGQEIAEIEFGFTSPPPVTHELRKKRYGDWIQKNPGEILPYQFAHETNPIFDAVWRETRLSMKAIKRLADRIAAKVVIVYLPLKEEVDGDEWREYVKRSRNALGGAVRLDHSLSEQRVETMARQEGMEFLSLKPLVLEKGVTEMYQDHLSRMGHHWVADSIARRLVNSSCCRLPEVVRRELQVDASAR